jgi:Ca-activated chloride channel homolog
MCRWPDSCGRRNVSAAHTSLMEWLTRLLKPTALCSALLLASAVLLSAQDVIRVDVNLVHVTATVRNTAGALIGNLKKEDFEIFDNGVRQQIAVFQRQSEQPLSIALLIDTSGSTAKDLKYETDSATRFLRAFLNEGHPEDAVALYSFNYDVTEGRFTHSLRSLEASLKMLRGEAGTALYDAIFFASRALERREGRKALIVVTDGGDTVSRHTLKQSIEAAHLANAVIYPIVVLPITNEAGRNIGGENALAFMAEGTGGRTFVMPVLSPHLDQAFSDIISELRTQYLLGFYPRGVPLTKERFHKLQVRAVSRELRVSARNGYYGEAVGAAGTLKP